jgi:hypothetical protein
MTGTKRQGASAAASLHVIKFGFVMNCCPLITRYKLSGDHVVGCSAK